jgi:hypothetical protein
MGGASWFRETGGLACPSSDDPVLLALHCSEFMVWGQRLNKVEGGYCNLFTTARQRLDSCVVGTRG